MSTFSATFSPLPALPIIKSYDQIAFEEFHHRSPQVYVKLVELARRVKHAGHARYSIKSLFEQVRWHYMMETSDKDFKLNNNYHSRYARIIMQNEPDLKGFFELRALATSE